MWEIVRNNRELDIDNAYYVDTGLASSESFSESLDVRKEYYDQWKFIWANYKTNPFLKDVVVNDGDVVSVELPRLSSSRRAEIMEDQNALSEVGHGWGYAWAFALNQMLVGSTNGAAIVDTLMRCRKENNFCQTLSATEFTHNSLWLSNKNFNRRYYLGQSQYATSIRNAEFINKLEN